MSTNPIGSTSFRNARNPVAHRQRPAWKSLSKRRLDKNSHVLFVCSTVMRELNSCNPGPSKLNLRHSPVQVKPIMPVITIINRAQLPNNCCSISEHNCRQKIPQCNSSLQTLFGGNFIGLQKRLRAQHNNSVRTPYLTYRTVISGFATHWFLAIAV